ncbi:MAG: 3-phosphoshikimate 1-carboxyvinyltransferase, partial [Clostridia bacterium]|nr:3-phosphoshikimate 1-carboxyvinyltransferase [Clostridia bacterium]
MDVTVTPSLSKPEGSVAAPGSKSELIRLIICAALSGSPTVIGGFSPSDDVGAALSCVRALGANVEAGRNVCRIIPGEAPEGIPPFFDCGESATVLRFMLPVASAVLGRGSFTGSGRLPGRPLGALISAMRTGGVSFEYGMTLSDADSEDISRRKRLPLRMTGRLRPGVYRLPGNISSQYVSGMLTALALTPGESRIELTTKLESAPYADMTADTLRLFGTDIRKTDGGYAVRGRHRLLSPGSAGAGGDWSAAAFFLTAGAIGGRVTVTGLDPRSPQGDRRITDLLRLFGAAVDADDDGGITVSRPEGGLTAVSADISDTPDLLPALAVAAAFADGESVFTGGSRLRLKESDRLASVTSLINALGGEA